MNISMVKRLVLASIFFIFGACISKKENWQKPIPYAAAQTKKNSAKSTKGLSRRQKERTVVNASKIKKMQKRQAIRLSKIEYYKLKRFIGEREDGLLGIRTKRGLNKADKKKVVKLVEAENKDREMLYSEVIKQNNLNKKMQIVMRKNFFDSYQEWAPKGSYFFLNGKWQIKGH